MDGIVSIPGPNVWDSALDDIASDRIARGLCTIIIDTLENDEIHSYIMVHLVGSDRQATGILPKAELNDLYVLYQTSLVEHPTDNTGVHLA